MSRSTSCAHAALVHRSDCVPVTMPAVPRGRDALDRVPQRPANGNACEVPERHRAPLTDRQRQIYDLLVASVRDRGYPPTLRELRVEMGLRSTNGVNDHLRTLVRKGYLAIEPGKARGRRLVALDVADEATVSVGEARKILGDLAGVLIEPGSQSELVARLARTVLQMARQGARREGRGAPVLPRAAQG